MRGVDFDRYLLAKKGAAQYRLDKVKGGRCSSTAGCPRPYAKKNMQKARLFSPMIVGKTLLIVPKHNYLVFHPPRTYEWHVIEPGVGKAQGIELTAEEISEHFIVKRKEK